MNSRGGDDTYQWDAAGRLTQATVDGVTSRFAYLGDGSRISMTVGSEKITYTLDLAAPLVQVLVAHEAAAGTTYLYGIARIGEDNGGWQYYLADHLGSVRSLVDAEGSVAGTRAYQPYGAPFSSAGVAESVYGFTGEQMDPSGLVYLRARYYDPARSWFLSEDTVSGSAKHPLTQHPWLYALANPTRYIDPSGQQVEPPDCDPGGVCLTGTAGPYNVTISVFVPAMPESPPPPVMDPYGLPVMDPYVPPVMDPYVPPVMNPYAPPSPLMPNTCSLNTDFWDILRYIKAGTGVAGVSGTRTDVEQPPMPIIIFGWPVFVRCRTETEVDTSGPGSTGECDAYASIADLAQAGVTGQAPPSLEGGFFIEIGGQRLELKADSRGPFAELNLFFLHLKTRAAVYRFVLAAQRSIAEVGFYTVGRRAWGLAYVYKSTVKKNVVTPGDDPRLALDRWSRHYYPMKQYPEGTFFGR